MIDQFLWQVRAYNRTYPKHPLAVKLRVWAGFMAPDWAKNIGGAPISVTHNGNPHTIGRFWSPAYRKAFTNLQTLLAAKYDNDPLIREVAVTQCRASVGVRCVLDNHDLDTTPPGGIGPIQAYMQTLGPEIEFQTYRETPANFEGTIRRGVALGASSIELWQDFGGFPLVAPSTLRHWAHLLAANSGNP